MSLLDNKKHDSLGYVRGYGRTRGSGYGYVSGGPMRMSSRRKTPTSLPLILAIAAALLLVILVVGGSTWWNYSRFTRAARSHDPERVQLAFRAGTRSAIPGSSSLFWWFSTRRVSSELSKAANEGVESAALDAFVETYRSTPDLIDELVVPKAISAVTQYQDKLIEEQVAAGYLEIGLAIRPQNTELIEGKKTFDILVASREAFAAAKIAATQPYGSEEAADLYELVAEIDHENYAIAQKEIPELRKIANEEMTTWTTAVKHFTLNPLLAFPYQAPLDYSNDYITTVEFDRILKQLYDNGYILVGLETLFSVEASDVVVPTTIRIPKGKQPLVLSIENLSYSTRHEGRGMVDKLIVRDDKIGTFTSAEHAGTASDVVSFDNDVIPILENFIEANPVFSWKGARATISVAGYSGNFGYRTAYGNDDQEEEIRQAKEVAKALEDKGYTFASMGFEYIEMSTIELDQIKNDMQLWLDQTSNIVGTTPLFFWPFGDALPQDSLGAAFLRQMGYRSFSQIGPNGFEEFTGYARIDERAFLDGNSLYNWPERFDGYFDTAT
ncbi:MAG: hypothetical protein FWD41_03875, partial [Actinomycetia bacterium]|nr:hypothetical protein [Actinomycetes bacterium]